MELKSKNITLLPTDDGKDTAKFTLAAASLKNDRSILAWKTENVTLVPTAPLPYRLAEVVSRFQLTINVPRKTQSLRVVLENQDGGDWCRRAGPKGDRRCARDTYAIPQLVLRSR